VLGSDNHQSIPAAGSRSNGKRESVAVEVKEEKNTNRMDRGCSVDAVMHKRYDRFTFT